MIVGIVLEAVVISGKFIGLQISRVIFWLYLDEKHGVEEQPLSETSSKN